MGCCCCCGSSAPRVLPEEKSEQSEADLFAELLKEELGPGNKHGWQIKSDWPKSYDKKQFMMRVSLRDHHETGNPNKLLRGDGKYKGVTPEDFLGFLLKPDLPGLKEWVDVETLPDGFIKYCRVKAPCLAARDHCWKYTIDRREDGSIFVCIRTTTHPKCPEKPGVIRAYYYNSSVFKMSDTEEGVMEMTEFIFQDLGGGLPPSLMNAALPKGTLEANKKEMKVLLEKKKGSE
ncbi:Stard5 [Symbiodinium sp. CCMP2592]|nr:Stard5 [Symbiodinium sp. CCMP2592]